MAELIALQRGKARPADLTEALDALGIGDGEHFLIVHPSALDPAPRKDTSRPDREDGSCVQGVRGGEDPDGCIPIRADDLLRRG